MSLYFSYIKESRGLDCVSGQNGFVTFKINGEECYIEDIYIVDEHRKSGIGSNLMDKVVIRAKEKGCKFLSATVGCRITNPEVSLMSCFGYGFKILAAANDIILLKMEL